MEQQKLKYEKLILDIAQSYCIMLLKLLQGLQTKYFGQIKCHDLCLPKINYILNQTENKHFIFTIHSLVQGAQSLSQNFSILLLLYSNTFLFGYCHILVFFSPKKFEKYLKHETTRNLNLCLVFFLKLKCNLLRYAENRSFTCLLLGSF